MSKIEKKIKIMKLLNVINDRIVSKFFDYKSDKMLDLKIEVLTKLSKGIKPNDIKEYYDILELYPKDKQIWD